MKKLGKIAALTLALLICFTATASAATISMANGSSLYLRSGPGRNYDSVGVVHDGDSVSVVKYGSVWSKIKTASGKTGYVKNLYINDGDANYASGTTYFGTGSSMVTTARVNVRSGASTGTSVITTLSKGTKVTARGKNGSFYLVSLKDGSQGYVSGKYLSASGSSSSGGSSGGAAAKVVIANGSSLYLRSGPGRSYDSCGTVKDGDAITVVSRGSIWSKVRTSGGKTGYIKNLYIKDGNTSYASGTSYFKSGVAAVTTANVNLRSGASTATSVITTLKKGTEVTELGKNGSFYLVKDKDGVQGYVSGKYLKTK